jgi:alkanesulfonate monooxygenase SsuD/methylene tetrahydromethanopterin reductase-like flavin-dependent oxidoreductase (luciferase family)
MARRTARSPAATLDLLSEGRLDFGVGKGYRYNEFMGFAMPLEEADARFEEALAIITKHGLQSNASLTTAASGRSS